MIRMIAIGKAKHRQSDVEPSRDLEKLDAASGLEPVVSRGKEGAAGAVP
jgi:hypothetical protein